MAKTVITMSMMSMVLCTAVPGTRAWSMPCQDLMQYVAIHCGHCRRVLWALLMPKKKLAHDHFFQEMRLDTPPDWSLTGEKRFVWKCPHDSFEIHSKFNPVNFDYPPCPKMLEKYLANFEVWFHTCVDIPCKSFDESMLTIIYLICKNNETNGFVFWAAWQ